MKLTLVCLILALGVGRTPLPAQTTVPASGDFFYTRQLDDFTDEDRSSIVVRSDDGDSLLVWGCSPGGLAILLSTGYMIGEDDQVDFMWRVDRNEPSPTIRGPQSNDNTSAFIPPHWVYSFTREAIAGTTVVIQVTDPFDRDSERYRYSLMGLTASLRLLPCYRPPAIGPAEVPEGNEWVVDIQERQWVSADCLGTLLDIPVERRRFFGTLTEVFVAGYSPSAGLECRR